jgi:cell division protein FtsW (lipid II flippase)
VTIAGQSLVSAEFARVLFIVAAAGLLSETGRLLSLPPARFRGIAVPDPRAVGPLLGAFAVTALLLLANSDLGPLLLLALTLLVMMWAAGGRWTWTVAGVLGVFVGLLTVGMAVGKVRSRILALAYPSSSGTAAQDQLARSQWAVAEGGMAGAGPDRYAPHALWVPNAEGVIAAWSQLVGLLGLISVIVVIAVLVSGVLRQARDAPAFQHLLAVGVMAAWSIQLLLVAASTVGVFPLVGLSVPPFTTGGSEFVAWAGALGLALGGAHLAPAGFGRQRTRLAVSPRTGRLLAGLAVCVLGVLASFVNTAVLSRQEIIDRPGNPRAALAFTAPRGRILDVHGRVLAADRSGRRSYADPAVSAVVGVVSVQTGMTGLERAFDH